MILRGPILIPRADGSVNFIRDGVISGESRIDWIGPFDQFPGRDCADIERSRGVIAPPFFDNHIHIPQHPIRGHFMDGIGANPSEGRLIAGLNRNVFPAEGKCGDREYAELCVREFLRDTLAHGVVGGAAYMTVHLSAARVALEILPSSWSVGLVMMNQNCPEFLRNDEDNFDRDAEALARDFGRRYIVTDRFAVACDSSLRQRGVAIAKRHQLRMQTHLNEQLSEKRFVERTLYPGQSYTNVYLNDGLLDHTGTILAHCIHMTDAELDTLRDRHSAIAHCPVSNTLLCSGIMPLDAVIDRGIDYAICTDVGASPTTSLLNEMSQFIKVHAGRSKRATPSEAFFRTTLGATRMMGMDDRFGRLEAGAPLSFVEIAFDDVNLSRCTSPNEVIGDALLEMPDNHLTAELNALAAGTLDAGPQLDALSADVASTVARLDRKIHRVIVDGVTCSGG